MSIEENDATDYQQQQNEEEWQQKVEEANKNLGIGQAGPVGAIGVLRGFTPTPFFKEVWETLSAVNVNQHTAKVGRFTYLSWSWAWATLMEYYPQSTYEFKDSIFFEDLKT